MAFYYPLTLGALNHISQIPTQDPPHQIREYKAWREGISRPICEYKEHPESRVLEQFLRAKNPNRFWLILGEPGAGKTTLLETWFTRVVRRTTKVRLGSLAPALVRLRAVPKQIWRLDDDNKFADSLWDFSSAEKALLESEAQSYKPQYRRVFEPIWFLDGVDEIQLSLDERLFQKLANLPGRKLVTSRAAIYESMRKAADRYKGREYEIFGLDADDRQGFIQQALPSKEEDAKELFKDIERNMQLRMLASNPLMLSLMVEVTCGNRSKIALPMSRADFYSRAIDNLWHRKVRGNEAALQVRSERDKYLTEAAAEMGLTSLSHEFVVRNRHLRRGLQLSGLVRIDETANRFEFMHLTFQEYYLARYLCGKHFKKVLKNFWRDPRYEETLALVVSILFQNGEVQKIEEGICWLVQWGEQIHGKNPLVLWRLGRSPLRVAYHLLARSAIPLESKCFNRLWEAVLERELVKGSIRRQLSLSVDSLTPPQLLASFADHRNRYIRCSVAANENTPPKTLNKLAKDKEAFVRRGVAWNENIPVHIASELARDEDEYVRRLAASNRNTPPEILGWLLKDRSPRVRYNAATNKNLSLEQLPSFIREPDPEFRRYFAWNPVVPLEMLFELMNDPDHLVRTYAARHRNISSMELERLALSVDQSVREGVAANENTSSEALGTLSDDEQEDVRVEVAHNPSTPSAILLHLANDEGEMVRMHAAENPNIPEAALRELAQTGDWCLTQGICANPNTPRQLLLKLSRTDDQTTLETLALNENCPPEILSELAKNGEEHVRQIVALNEKTPPKILAAEATEKIRGHGGILKNGKAKKNR